MLAYRVLVIISIFTSSIITGLLLFFKIDNLPNVINI